MANAKCHHVLFEFDISREVCCLGDNVLYKLSESLHQCQSHSQRRPSRVSPPLHCGMSPGKKILRSVPSDSSATWPMGVSMEFFPKKGASPTAAWSISASAVTHRSRNLPWNNWSMLKTCPSSADELLCSKKKQSLTNQVEQRKYSNVAEHTGIDTNSHLHYLVAEVLNTTSICQKVTLPTRGLEKENMLTLLGWINWIHNQHRLW